MLFKKVSQNDLSSIGLIFMTTLMQASASALIKEGMNLIKSSTGGYRSIPVFILAMVLYGGSFPIFSYCLSKLRLSIAQPIVSGSMFLYTLVISILFFHENLAAYKLIGIAAILAGIGIMVI